MVAGTPQAGDGAVDPGAGAPLVCFGETIVDLIADAPLAGPAGAAYRPCIGGAPTNVAVVSRRCGTPVMLAGGAGDDALGRWLRERLLGDCLDLAFWHLHPAAATPLALVDLDAQGVPDFSIHAAGLASIFATLRPLIGAVASVAGALVLGSNTLVGEVEREVTLAMVDEAERRAVPILFDPNLRPHRWTEPALGVELARRVCRRACLVKVSADEARLISGERDLGRAAERICDLGARVTVVTLGAGGAMVRGEVSGAAPAHPARAVDTTGAGDAVLGVLAAALWDAGWDVAAVLDALPWALKVAARVAEARGALTGLPAVLRREPA